MPICFRPQGEIARLPRGTGVPRRGCDALQPRIAAHVVVAVLRESGARLASRPSPMRAVPRCFLCRRGVRYSSLFKLPRHILPKWGRSAPRQRLRRNKPEATIAPVVRLLQAAALRRRAVFRSQPPPGSAVRTCFPCQVSPDDAELAAARHQHRGRSPRLTLFLRVVCLIWRRRSAGAQPHEVSGPEWAMTGIASNANHSPASFPADQTGGPPPDGLTPNGAATIGHTPISIRRRPRLAGTSSGLRPRGRRASVNGQKQSVVDGGFSSVTI